MKKEGPSTPRDRDGDVPIPKPVMFGRVEALPTPSLGSEVSMPTLQPILSVQ